MQPVWCPVEEFTIDDYLEIIFVVSDDEGLAVNMLGIVGKARPRPIS